MPQRKPSIKLPEIGECLEQLQILEPNVTEEGFQAISTMKESLEVIKGKWKVLNTNYKNLFQEKTNYEGEIEKMTQFISKMNDKFNEEKTKHIKDLNMIQEKLVACENNAMKQLTENKVLIEQFNLDKSELLKELAIHKLDISNLNDLLDDEKTKDLEKQNEIISLSIKISELLLNIGDKDKTIVNLKTESERILFDLKSKYDELLLNIEDKDKTIVNLKTESERILFDLKSKCDELLLNIEDKDKTIVNLKTESERILFDFRSKNDELLSNLNVLSNMELKNKMISEDLEKLRAEKDHLIKELKSKISTLKYEKELDLEKLGEQIQMLQSQKKNAENLLTELTIKLDKKSKCCLM
jgi:hypothetical protein